MCCWKNNKLCGENEFLKCFACFETVHQTALDEHTETHPDTNSGIYTCLGIHNSKFIDSKVIYGCVGQKVSSVEGQQPDVYKCFLCSLQTKNLNHFKKHLGTAHQVKVSKSNFVPRCKYCHLYFAANSQQEDHEYFCRGADLPYCGDCDAQFASPNSWRRHINEEHAGKYGPRKMFGTSTFNKSLLCNSCGVTFRNRSAFKYHERKKHANQPTGSRSAADAKQKHVCDYCGAAFLRHYTLTEHVNFRHTKTKQYPCKYCDRLFLRRTELMRHLVNHRKSNAIQCSMCKFQGFSKYELKRHFLKDHKIGQFKCTCCTAKFTDYEKYEDHKYLKLCPRYHQVGSSKAGYSKEAQLAQERDSDLTMASLVGEDGDSNIYTWVNANGDLVQAYIKKEDLVNAGKSGQIESLQLMEMSDGQVQIGMQVPNDVMRASSSVVSVADVQAGAVELMQTDDAAATPVKAAAGIDDDVDEGKSDHSQDLVMVETNGDNGNAAQSKTEALTLPLGLQIGSQAGDGNKSDADDRTKVTEMSLEDFQQLYGSGALESIKMEDTENGKCYVVYI